MQTRNKERLQGVIWSDLQTGHRSLDENVWLWLNTQKSKIRMGQYHYTAMIGSAQMYSFKLKMNVGYPQCYVRSYLSN